MQGRKNPNQCCTPKEFALTKKTGQSPDLQLHGMHKSPHQTGNAAAGQGIIPLAGSPQQLSSSLMGEGGGGGLHSMMSSTHMQSNAVYLLKYSCSDEL